MYKRRDWVYTQKGAEGNADSSSSDDDSDDERQKPEEEEVSGSEEDSDLGSDEEDLSGEDDDEDDDEDEDEGDFEDDNMLARRLEDLSEDDFTEGEEEDEFVQEVNKMRKIRSAADARNLIRECEDLKKGWLSNSAEAVAKKRAMKCRLCKGVMMLNASTFLDHINSKKHKSAMKAKGIAEAAGPIAPAELVLDEEFDIAEAETHGERLDRVRREAEAASAATAKQAKKMSSKKRKSADTTDNGGDEGGDAGQPAFNRKEKGVWKKMKAEGLVEQKKRKNKGKGGAAERRKEKRAKLQKVTAGGKKAVGGRAKKD